jgi:hypothetical protein
LDLKSLGEEGDRAVVAGDLLELFDGLLSRLPVAPVIGAFQSQSLELRPVVAIELGGVGWKPDSDGAAASFELALPRVLQLRRCSWKQYAAYDQADRLVTLTFEVRSLELPRLVERQSPFFHNAISRLSLDLPQHEASVHSAAIQLFLRP